MLGLGDLPGGASSSVAYNISSNGTTIIGQSDSTSGTEAFRWMAATGMIGLGDLPGGTFSSTAYGVSADGSVIVGKSASSSGANTAYRWSAQSGMVSLGDLPGGQFSSTADAVSADGMVVVGTSVANHGSKNSLEAFRWTAQTGMVGLGDLPGGGFQSFAQKVSADGSIIVGQGYPESGSLLFIWDAQNGMRNFHDYLTSLGLNLAGWRLENFGDMNDDGTVFVGYGTNPAGQFEGWIATTPEPATTLPLLALIPLLCRPPRRAI